MARCALICLLVIISIILANGTTEEDLRVDFIIHGSVVTPHLMRGSTRVNATTLHSWRDHSNNQSCASVTAPCNPSCHTDECKGTTPMQRARMCANSTDCWSKPYLDGSFAICDDCICAIVTEACDETGHCVTGSFFVNTFVKKYPCSEGSTPVHIDPIKSRSYQVDSASPQPVIFNYRASKPHSVQIFHNGVDLSTNHDYVTYQITQPRLSTDPCLYEVRIIWSSLPVLAGGAYRIRVQTSNGSQVEESFNMTAKVERPCTTKNCRGNGVCENDPKKGPVCKCYGGHIWGEFCQYNCDDHRDSKFEGGFARDQGCKVKEIIYVDNVTNATGFVCNVTGKPLIHDERYCSIDDTLGTTNITATITNGNGEILRSLEVAPRGPARLDPQGKKKLETKEIDLATNTTIVLPEWWSWEKPKITVTPVHPGTLLVDMSQLHCIYNVTDKTLSIKNLTTCSGQFQCGVSNSKNDEEDTLQLHTKGYGRNLESDSRVYEIIFGVLGAVGLLVFLLVLVVLRIRKLVKKDGGDAECRGLIAPEEENSGGILITRGSNVRPSHGAIHTIPSHPVTCTERNPAPDFN